MALYSVDAHQVQQAAARAAASGASLRAEATAMVAHLAQLESHWQGGAAAAFGDLLQQWRAAQVQLETALDSISAGLSAAATGYEQAEAGAARAFAR